MASKGINPGKTKPVLEKPGQSQKIDPDDKFQHVVTPDGALLVKKAEGELGDKVAIAGFSTNNFGIFASSEQGIGLFARGTQLAAQFDGAIKVGGRCDIAGDVHSAGSLFVKGDVQLAGEDYAEDFDVADMADAEPGTVMVLDEQGGVRPSSAPYDRRVAGVVSGAGGFKPAIILGRRATAAKRQPLALMGKVWCQVDASTGPIAVGDMLTTSATPGHAMRAADPARAFGAVIGKALRPLATGLGLVPILVALQ